MLNQKVLFINALFTSDQQETIKVSVRDRHDESLTMTMEVKPGPILAYRFLFTDGDATLWATMEDVYDVIDVFRRCSLI